MINDYNNHQRIKNLMKDHSCFELFSKWHGKPPEGYKINFLGAKRKSMYKNFEIGPAREDEVLPDFNEEYFEWIDMLEAVLTAKECFTFIELGAGYGPWSVNAALAAKIIGKDYRIIAVEGEPQHYKWLKENIAENSLNVNQCKLIEAAVTSNEGYCEFYSGDQTSWYGQRIRFKNDPPLSKDYLERGVHFVQVKNINLHSIIKDEKIIDLIHMDVQGSELEIIQSVKNEISSKVKKFHIGTHSAEIEEELRSLFTDLGWIPTYDYGLQKIHKTEYGNIYFIDGVQGWVNPKFDYICEIIKQRKLERTKTKF